MVARVFARAADLPVRSRTRMFCALALGYFYYANKSAAAPFAALRRLVFSELARKHSTVGPSVLALAVFQAVLVLTLVDLSVRVAVLAFSVEEVIPVLTCSQLKRTRGARACECVHTFVALPVEVAAHAKTVCTMVGAPPLATNVAAVLPRWPPHADAF